MNAYIAFPATQASELERLGEIAPRDFGNYGYVPLKRSVQDACLSCCTEETEMFVLTITFSAEQLAEAFATNLITHNYVKKLNGLGLRYYGELKLSRFRIEWGQVSVQRHCH